MIFCLHFFESICDLTAKALKLAKPRAIDWKQKL